MGKMAFVFPGQGAQYVGMGKNFFEQRDSAKRIFAEADAILGFSVQDLCFQGPLEELQKTSNTQPALLTVSHICALALKEAGITPDLVAGHSLGEYSALLTAGVFDFANALQLVRKRGLLMEQAASEGTGGMAAILGLDHEKIQAACQAVQGIVEPVNYNCPGQIVIAGENEALDAAIMMAKEKGAKRAVRLAVSGPFHSSLMRSVGEKLDEELQKKELRPAAVPIVVNVDARTLVAVEEMKQSLVRQVYSSVQWENCIRAMLEQGVDRFIEVGPGKVLSGLIKKIEKTAQLFHVEDEESLEKTLHALKGGQ